MRWKNVSPLGDLDVVGVGLIEFGEEFDAPDSATVTLEASPDFEPVETTEPGMPADTEEIPA
jgi:hypothetical protein